MAIFNVPASVLPNVVQNVDVGNSQGIAELRKTVRPMLLEFIDKVAPKYPHYTFCIEMGSEVHLAWSVKVHQGTEVIGKVYIPRPNGVEKYALTTENIRKERTRGDRDIRTGSLKIAIKAFNRHFQPRTTLEMLTDKVQGVQAVLRSANSVRLSFKTKFDQACFAASDLLMAQWDTIAAAAIAGGYPAAELTGVAEKYQEYLIAKELQDMHQKYEGQYVVITDSAYYTADIDLRVVQTLSSETLPIHVRTKVGMLKLVPDRTFVMGVGVRSSDKVFYVVPEVV